MVYIIAEVGVNHNGDIKKAKQLVDIASESFADAVKFQTFWHIPHVKKYELTRNEFEMLHDYCNDREITFLSTPHTFEAIEFLDDLVPMYKVASSYLGNINFLKAVANKNKKMLISTGSLLHYDGMATDEMVERAIESIEGSDIVLMHCVSRYPCKDPWYNRLIGLKGFNKPLGLSDHSLNIKPKIFPFLEYIEKHIKIDNNCIDKEVSLNEKQFRKFICFVRSSMI